MIDNNGNSLELIIDCSLNKNEIGCARFGNINYLILTLVENLVNISHPSAENIQMVLLILTISNRINFMKNIYVKYNERRLRCYRPFEILNKTPTSLKWVIIII